MFYVASFFSVACQLSCLAVIPPNDPSSPGYNNTCPILVRKCTPNAVYITNPDSFTHFLMAGSGSCINYFCWKWVITSCVARYMGGGGADYRLHCLISNSPKLPAV